MKIYHFTIASTEHYIIKAGSEEEALEQLWDENTKPNERVIIETLLVDCSVNVCEIF